MPREVVRVVSPGIAYDDAGLEARENHYLAAVERDGAGPYGIATLDLSTGELSACEAADAASAVSALVRLDPREVLVAGEAQAVVSPFIRARPRAVTRSCSALLEAEADALLDAQLGAGEARASCPSAIARRAAARCVGTARASEAGRPLPVARLAFLDLGETLALDDATQAHLELTRSVDGGVRGSLLDASSTW